MEGIFWGVVGGTAMVLANKARLLARRNRETGPAGAEAPRARSIASRLRWGLEETVASTRELFAECKAECEATRVAIDEVRHPSSSKIVRIH
jgi:hypothetical protein